MSKPLKVKIKSTKPENYTKLYKKYEFNANRYVDRLGVYFVSQIQRAMQTTSINPMTNRSQRGSPPAIDSGNLVSSIQYKHIGMGEGKVFTNTEYAERLELRMDRPFMSKFSVPYQNTMRLALSTVNTIGKV